MNCSQCSATINDPQAVFCLRCGSRLPPAVPVARLAPVGQMPPRTLSPAPRPVLAARPMSDTSRRNIVKIIVAALVGAVILGWVMGVSLYLAVVPREIMFSVDNEIAVKAQGQTGMYADILNQTLNDIFVPTWCWAFVGLVLGAGVGWWLTRPKAL